MIYGYSDDNYDVGYDHDCKECKSYKEQMEYFESDFRELIKILYAKGEVDCANLEKYLDSICYWLEIKINQGDLNLRRG